MKILLFCALLLHEVLAQPGFGTSYLKNSRLCHQWNCINTKLGLPDALPPRDQYTAVLLSLLPSTWRPNVGKVLDVCYGDRPRRYTNTCPGQAIMHCVVEQLIENCPEENLRKDDACAPLSTLAGFKYMFSQSRYENFEKNLPTDRRPEWFLKNYFSSKCCNLPPILNSTVLAECGINSLIHYYTHEPKPHGNSFNKIKKPLSTQKNEPEKVKVVDFNIGSITNTPEPYEDVVKIVDFPETIEDNEDPLSCCEMSAFIDPAWRDECDFRLSWSDTRLSIKEDVVETTVPTTTTEKAKLSDVKVVPLSCEQETCVFQKLNIVSASGSVDIDAFKKLLDNLTDVHSSWTKAKARVVTKCLSKPLTFYTEECELNKVLTCTFDVLSENCPHAHKKADPCKHTNILKEDTTCQISSSKYRPKNRRRFCGLPNLVNHEVLAECGMNSVSHLEYVEPPTTSKPGKYKWWSGKYTCKDSTQSTKCIMKKMGVLNKYGFLDYFKMKDHVKRFADGDEVWSPFTQIYLDGFSTMPLYREYCSSSKKLLNVIDAMLSICPVSKRKNTSQCNKIFNELTSKDKVEQETKHFHHVYNGPKFSATTLKPKNTVQKNPIYDFGIFSFGNVPPVVTIDVKVTTRRPKVLLPVYLGASKGSLSIRPYNDGILRSSPFVLHNKIANAQTTDTVLP